jgi:hypothetical protein
MASDNHTHGLRQNPGRLPGGKNQVGMMPGPNNALPFAVLFQWTPEN